jgi:hypothetical protein
VWFTKKSKRVDAQSTEDNGIASASVKQIWLPFATTVNEIIPGYDSVTCVNEQGHLAVFILPNKLISLVKAREIPHFQHQSQEQYGDFLFIQDIRETKDQSRMVKALYDKKQAKQINALTFSYNKGTLKQELKKGKHDKLLRELPNIAIASESFNCPLVRINTSGSNNSPEPDDIEKTTGEPVFIYSSPENRLQIDKDQFRRGMIVRGILAEQSKEIMQGELLNKGAEHEWLIDPIFTRVVSRVEAELFMSNRVARPYSIDLLLDPDKSDLVWEPEPEIRLKPEWESEAQKARQSPSSWFSQTNWAEPDIVQVILHVDDPKNQLPQFVTSPAVTIFRDELGYHALTTHLFVISTKQFELPLRPGELPLLDKLPGPKIPRINWQAVSGALVQAPWESNAVIGKILWLAARNLCSHLLEEPSEVILAVTPIEEGAFQLAVALGEREGGAPYGYAILSKEKRTYAIPIFPSSSFVQHRDDEPSLVRLDNGTIGLVHYDTDTVRPAGDLRVKNYEMTMDGKRRSEGESKLFDRPIYSSVISGKAYPS